MAILTRNFRAKTRIQVDWAQLVRASKPFEDARNGRTRTDISTLSNKKSFG
jgi:hypothetical protein